MWSCIRKTVVRALRAGGLSRKRLIGFALVAATLWALTGLTLRYAYNDAIRGAFEATENLARSLAEYQASSARAIDLSLINLREEWQRDPTTFASAVQSQAERLARERVIQVAVVNAAGDLVFSRLPAPASLNFADRDYFRAQRDAGVDALHISTPVFGRVTQQWAIQFTRPIFQSGAFGGLIVVAVPPPALETVYRDIRLGVDGVITLVRNDGQILARSSDLARGVGVSLASMPALNATAPASGSFRGRGLVDGVPRYFSYRRLDAHPLTVLVGQSERAVLASYSTLRDVMVFGAAIATLLIWALFRLSESRERERGSRQALEAAVVEAERKRIEERERIMLELHDGSLQSIYAVSMQVEACRQLIERDPIAAQAIASRVQPLLSRIIQDIRSLLDDEPGHGGAPAPLADELARLIAAIPATGPRVTVDADPAALEALSPEQSTHVLRIAAEAVSNIARHARAEKAGVSLRRNGDAIRLAIEDDGIGLPQDYESRGHGIAHIRTRAAKLGATLHVESDAAHGTRIVVDFAPARR